MKIPALQNCSVFLDTNILIYAFTTTRFTPACEDLLEKVRTGVVKGHVNTTVIDEFFHKVLLMQIYTEKGLKPSDAITLLKQNPERIADYPLPFDVTHEVLHDYGIIVLDTAPLMDETLGFSKKYGLLFSDALHAASCRYYALDHLITNDRDFSRVEGVSVIAP